MTKYRSLVHRLLNSNRAHSTLQKRRRYFCLILFLFGILTYGLSSVHNSQAKHSSTVTKASFTLGDESKGKAFLSTEDDFTNALSEFDLRARMKSLEKVSKASYLKFAGAAARDWTPDERQKIMRVIPKVQSKIEQLSISLPDEILIIKTSGVEEANAAYTRRNAIILPEDDIKKSDEAQLENLLTHETWHVISRYNPKLKLRMYAAMGFTPCSVQLPQALLPLKVTNPDAIDYSYCYQVIHQGKPIRVAPFLYATKQYDDDTKKKVFFQYLTSIINAINRKHEAVMVPSLLNVEDGNGILNVWEVEGFDIKTFGTGYLVHPEEITAEHFVKILRKDFKHPLTEKLAKELHTPK